jgi:hypothetical protein
MQKMQIKGKPIEVKLNEDILLHVYNLYKVHYYYTVSTVIN